MSDIITGVQFGITSPDEILRRSVVEVITDKTYQGNNPVPGGVFDSRLGVIDSGKICPTCKHTNMQCQGHFGHITLARPVYLYQFLEYIEKMLYCVCLNCSNLYITKNDEDKAVLLRSTLSGVGRLGSIRAQTVEYKNKAAKAAKGNAVPCSYCSTPIVKKVEKVLGTVCTLQGVVIGSEDKPIPIQSEMVLRCFQRMAEDTIKILGFSPRFSHPAWMVCTVLAVPPLTVRPPVVMDDNQRMDDDLSHKLIDIVRANQKLRDQIDKGQPRDYIEQHTTHLEFHVATYVDNDIKGMPPAAQRSGRPLKTLKSRMGAKTGRVRGNLMGKRVDFSARSVITPDANIDVDELGVPMEIAMNLTKPEIVTPYNRDRLYMYVRNGPSKHPGAKSVHLKSTSRLPLSLKYVNADMIELNEGDVVHRHLIDGDNVLFNRQPSLHKGSMECHRVKVLPYSTFRLNVSATKPYNADFDGDEMNMHVPQSIAAETELLKLASVTRLIVSPRLNAPIIQMVQDTLTGAYRISNPGVKIHEQAAMNMLSRIRRPLSAFKMLGESHLGTDVISSVFPLMNFNEKIKLENGKLVKGLLNKGAFNTPSEGILHVIFNDFGPERCGQFINEVQSIVTKFNLHTGFSTGASDLISNKETIDYVENTLAEGRRRVQEIITDVHAGRFVNISGRTDGAELENQIMNTLKEISAKITSRVSDSLPKSNRLLQMVKAGAKGDNLNITQMVALLGQQIVDGKRIQFTLPDRTLPHFSKFDDSAEARGFVESSFVKGLRPAEYFFHAMGGREGLIDTAVKTSDTGYIQRRMMKTMEDIHVEYDGTVRNNAGVVIQYQYGEDGIDSTAVESQIIELPTMTIEDVYKKFALSIDEVSPLLTEAITECPDMVDDILRDRDMLVKDVFRFSRRESVLAPVHLKRLIDRFRNPYSTKTDLLPTYIVENLENLLKEPRIAPNRLFAALVRYYLSPRLCIIEYRFTKDIFDEIVREIRYRYIKSCVHAGEMVGALAAQSIGEPTTQLTLNTFHSAGTVKAGATQGVPRITELLAVSRTPKNPLNFVYLDPAVSGSLDQAIMVQREIQKTTLRDITKHVRMYYDPYPLDTKSVVSEDHEILRSFQAFSLGKPECTSPWILRLEFDDTEMARRDMEDMVSIDTAIMNSGLRIMQCIHSDANSSKMVMRIVFESGVVTNMLSLRFMEDKVLDIVIAGASGVGRVYPRKVEKELIWDESVSGFACKTQYVLDVEGANMFELMGFQNVDKTRIFSNDIHEVMEVFGVEAARQAIYDEFNEVFAEAYVNYHHMSVLLDSITYQGRLVSADRFGMKKQDNGVLAKSSFEETSKTLFNAAVSAEFDDMSGVSANIMFGQKPPAGTGFVELMLDETRLPEGNDEEQSNILERANQRVDKATPADEGECKMEDIMMDF
jgi:DNA-directed RNA polymerase II subunit RPB1